MRQQEDGGLQGPFLNIQEQMKVGSTKKMTARAENANKSKRYKNVIDIMGTRSEVAKEYTSEATSSGPILETVNG